MTQDLLIIAGVVALSAALRSYRHPVLNRLGVFTLFFGTSFLIGWLLAGSLAVGLLLAASWLLLPWVEILTRARRLRLPADRSFRECRAPDAERFPNLEELSREVEDAGFEAVEDLGWDHENQRQFYRIFYQPASGTEATICLIEQDALSFYYLSITSRVAKDGAYLTWNYPFSYGLRTPPQLTLNRTPGDLSFQGMLAEHRLFLDRERVGVEQILAQSPEDIRERMQDDLRAQIAHNIDRGLLLKDRAGFVRYSARGLLFLWCQFLRDLVRLS